MFRTTGLIVLLIFLALPGNSQSSLCGPTTPTFTVNLTGQPNGLYTSPSVVRDDTCCGAVSPDRCIQFIVTLDPAAVGLIFTVCNGAVPPGALYYQVNCGPLHQVGTGICLTPPYPDTITFCKPGNNQNEYCIQSISPPSVVSLSQNCSALMWTYGFNDSTIVWNSIYPGPIGAYNGYLNCQTGCDSVWVTPQAGYPPYIDYEVCGTVTNGCNKSFCDTIRVNFPAPLTTSVTQTNVTCYGGSNGSASVNVGGGIPTYSYSWQPAGGTNSTANGLSAGTYTCTVIDDAGCTITNTFIIVQPPQLTATFTTNPATCSQSNGDATVLPSGGVSPYTYQWLIGQTSATATGLAPGVYQVVVGDANGCTLSLSVPISNVLPIVTASSSSVTCPGGSDGTATSNASGGIPPYGYLWSDGQTTSTATGLSAGSYTVATSSSGCINYSLVTITEPPTFTITVSAQSNVSCNGGADGGATVSITGGTPGYVYQWSNGQTGSTATGLAAGAYTVTTSDVQGCPVTQTISITQPPLLSASTATVTNVLCNGASTGMASVNVTGGTPSYYYSWSGGQSSSAATGLTAGSYTCIVTDLNGCTAIDTTGITEPPAIQITISGDTNTCAGHSTTLAGTAQGGTPGFSYLWNPSGVSTSSVVVAPTAVTSYSLVVTDANGCSQVAAQSVNTYAQPVAAFSTPNSCLSNSTQFTDLTTGGVNSWSWNFGDPSSGSNNISSIQNPSHTYGSAGSYTVSLIVSTPDGCVDSVKQVVIINPIPSVSFTSNTICLGNTTTFNNTSFITTGFITGWSWNFGDPASGPNNISSSQFPTHIFTAAGTFNVILAATSDSGCQSNVTIPVTVLPLPTASFVATKACMNTPVQFTDMSSLANQWLWDFGVPGTGSMQQNPTFTYTSQGTYQVALTVTSAGGCIDSIIQQVDVYPSPVPDFSPDTVCVGTPTSFVDLSVVSGGFINGWLWDFGDGTALDSSKSPTHVYLQPGTYTVTLIVDGSNGCSRGISKQVLVFPQPTAAYTYSPVDCISLEEAVDFTDLSYSNIANWHWNFGDGSPETNTQNPFHYFSDTGQFLVSLVVQDNNGCMDTTTSTICIYDWTFFIPNAFTPNENGKNDVFFGQGIGIIEYEMWIFDRWGNLIFHCDVDDLPQSLPCHWNGKVSERGLDLNGKSGRYVQEDVYVWKVRLTNVVKDTYTYVGSVTVVR